MGDIRETLPPRSYDIYAYADGERQQWIGGAPDVVSAAILAGSAFDAAQRVNPRTGVGVGIVDTSTDGTVAYVGWQTPEV